MTENNQFDIAVAGAGAAGLAAALTFAREGYRTCLIGPQNFVRDGRTVALFQGAICFLDAIGVWQRLSAYAAPLEGMRIIDDTGNLFHVPPADFRASELSLDAFGWNIPNVTLLEKLSEAAAAAKGVTCLPERAISCSVMQNRAEIVTESGKTIRASLVVASEGRNSALRQQAGIVAQTWGYPQTALTTILAHSRDHGNVSTEFHTRQGPFTLVPLRGRESSLVWLLAPEKAEKLLRMDDKELASAIENQAQHMLGTIEIAGPRAVVPMSGLSVDRYAAPRLALVGETAHVFPPIGAQGLNLGLRDVADLRDAVVTAADGDIGGKDVLQRYDRNRRQDAGSRTRGIDGLNRMLLAHYLPVDMLRAGGLMAVAGIAPLRRTVMRMGMRPLTGTPQLMQGAVQIQ